MQVTPYTLVKMRIADLAVLEENQKKDLNGTDVTGLTDRVATRAPTIESACCWSRSAAPQWSGSSVVSMIDKARMAGAANNTNGSIAAHEISQDSSQWTKNWP
jgi:hypothetical protein